MSPSGYSRQYKMDLRTAIDLIDEEQVARVIDHLREARDAGRAIFVCGNGGSAATASHFACDIVKGASFNRPSRFRIMALADSLPTLTAYSNDVGYECVFVEQLKNFAQPSDVVMAISGSGNSPNVLRAVEYANSSQQQIGFDPIDDAPALRAVHLLARDRDRLDPRKIRTAAGAEEMRLRGRAARGVPLEQRPGFRRQSFRRYRRSALAKLNDQTLESAGARDGTRHQEMTRRRAGHEKNAHRLSRTVSAASIANWLRVDWNALRTRLDPLQFCLEERKFRALSCGGLERPDWPAWSARDGRADIRISPGSPRERQRRGIGRVVPLLPQEARLHLCRAGL